MPQENPNFLDIFGVENFSKFFHEPKLQVFPKMANFVNICLIPNLEQKCKRKYFAENFKPYFNEKSLTFFRRNGAQKTFHNSKI